MDFDIPPDLAAYLIELDEFIEREIKPLEEQDDNIRFFDHRREDARTDWERGGLPNEEWEQLLHEAKRRADKAGHYRYPFPKQYGGRDGTNLGMAIIREHLAAKGLGLHCDLQNEHAIVGNNVGLLLMIKYGTDEQKKDWIDDLAEGRRGFAFGITDRKEQGGRLFFRLVAQFLPRRIFDRFFLALSLALGLLAKLFLRSEGFFHVVGDRRAIGRIGCRVKRCALTARKTGG